MADHPLDEVEEQVDLDGENDIEEMMDDDTEDPADDHYNRGDDYANSPLGSGIEDNYSEEEDQRTIQETITDNEDSRASGKEDEILGAKGDDERQKYAELLALPPHGSEVFVGGIHRDVTEEDLSELCEPFGEIFEVRTTDMSSIVSLFGRF